MKDMTEILFVIGITISIPSLIFALVSAVAVQMGLDPMMYGVYAGVCGLVIGLFPLGTAAILGAWSS